MAHLASKRRHRQIVGSGEFAISARHSAVENLPSALDGDKLDAAVKATRPVELT
jgi:hypothetical protein